MSKKTLTYKEAVSEIEDILQKIENEELDVDDLSTKVKQVSTLIAFCKKKLHETEVEVEKILKDIDSN
ncbi:MAG: exodeoxyribonuclease VII small subunit [Bacteroidetes bacterium GWF2_33_16]|nr:MAG: exodeoxyribonuclease VII small subunit [Bacteroidetes bacterium GWE2_32_14]OFY07901.1 MAG: exodeoxyribonuclease VII small subunit [Bacteroidetes bacterium GWF2_33_16]